MNTQKGIAPIIIIVLVVLAGTGVFAVVERNTLKGYFEKGDKPTESTREKLPTEFQNGEIPSGQDKQSSSTPQVPQSTKPTSGQFHAVIDSSMNLQDDGLTHGKIDPMVLGEDKKEFSLNAAVPVTFRWTASVPKTGESAKYRLNVWQLMQGQSGAQAMRSNQPIVTKDVDNVVEVTVSGIYTGPCRPPYLCDFVWAVETLSSQPSSGNTSTGVAPASATLPQKIQDGTAR